jgi:hypothetical protein|nr:MAG TPA: hypothetical protein [Caudoviricetes sp.]
MAINLEELMALPIAPKPLPVVIPAWEIGVNYGLVHGQDDYN